MGYRILLCSGYVPYGPGGAERLVACLKSKLESSGHEVDTVMLPFTWHTPESVIRSYAAWRTIELSQVESGVVDLVIALKFPAYAVEHPRKTVWLIQQFRQLYDLFGTQYSPYDPTLLEHTELRDTVRRMDTRTLGEAQRLFAISRNVAQRMYDHNDLVARVLYPPPPLDGALHGAAYGDYVFSISRLDQLKRVEHLVRAMSLTESPVRCRIAGDGPDAHSIRRLAERLGIEKRVEFLGSVSDREAVELYAGALAVYYAPYDEDYGFATVEAMKSGKPVLTYADSGGVLEFVQDGVTGCVLPTGDTSGMARCLDSLYSDRHQAAILGEAALDRVSGLSWTNTLRTLLGE
jgi:glycosyltransferase involved in cell wall biosynthesis